MRWTRTPNKYHAKKTVREGQVFDSKREAKRYTELLILQRAGKISDLRTQVEYELIPAQREPDTVGSRGGIKRGKVIERAVKYVADFVYVDENGTEIVEDAKGYKDGQAYALFVIKRKLMLYTHHIHVREV